MTTENNKADAYNVRTRHPSVKWAGDHIFTVREGAPGRWTASAVGFGHGHEALTAILAIRDLVLSNGATPERIEKRLTDGEIV